MAINHAGRDLCFGNSLTNELVTFVIYRIKKPAASLVPAKTSETQVEWQADLVVCGDRGRDIFPSGRQVELCAVFIFYGFRSTF